MTTRILPPDAPPPPDPDDELLPCGRLLSEVWTAWEEEGGDSHQESCPHCSRAVAELQHLETTVRRLDEHEAAAHPGGYDPTPLTERVMGIVRLELRPGHPLPLGEAGEDMWVMESVAARMLRAAAEEVPGVRAGSCRLVPDTDYAGQVSARLEILAPLTSAHLPALADEVRVSVRERADRALGVHLSAIDVHVVGLSEAPAPTPEGSDR